MDQRIALKWIRKHVHAFGGDPNNITVFGNSSGAGIPLCEGADRIVSSHAHLQTISRPLFRRMISQSGACMGKTRPLPLDHKHNSKRYNGLIQALGIQDLSPDDRVEKLRGLPWEDLIEVMKKLEDPDAMFPVVADGALTGGFWKEAENINDNKSIMVGNTKDDVLFQCEVTNSKGYVFCDFIRRKGEEHCKSFLLALPETVRETYFVEDQWLIGTLAFITDILYAATGQAIIMREPNAKVFSYMWAYPNHILESHFPEFSGISIHCTEMIYTTGLYLDELSPKQRELSCDMAKRWISFACGHDPWKAGKHLEYDFTVTERGEQKLVRYGDSEYRRVRAQDIIARDIDKYGSLLREFFN
jgi:carboxylesterase type B